jgi:hypothetical protein
LLPGGLMGWTERLWLAGTLFGLGWYGRGLADGCGLFASLGAC